MAHRMGNKQEELVAIVLKKSYDTVAITETWWMTHMTVVLQWLSINTSEGID